MMQMNENIFDSLSSLLVYPKDDYNNKVKECLEILKQSESPAYEYILKFADKIKESSLDNIQELYIRTFDLNPVCILEVGWHLFGERYERGTFIVKMRQTLRQLKLPESSELPDHLTHVLQALGRMDNDEASQFANMFALPAMEKMLKGFKKEYDAYMYVLKGIILDIKNRYSSNIKEANYG